MELIPELEKDAQQAAGRRARLCHAHLITLAMAEMLKVCQMMRRLLIFLTLLACGILLHSML